MVKNTLAAVAPPGPAKGAYSTPKTQPIAGQKGGEEGKMRGGDEGKGERMGGK